MVPLEYYLLSSAADMVKRSFAVKTLTGSSGQIVEGSVAQDDEGIKLMPSSEDVLDPLEAVEKGVDRRSF